MGTRMPRRRAATAATAVGLLVVLAACSDAPSAPAGPASVPASSAPTAGATDTAEFCAANLEIESAGSAGPEVDFETATPEEIQAALVAFGAVLEPIIVRIEAAAPAAVRDDVAVLAATNREALATGDPDAFETPEYLAAEDNLDGYLRDECGWESVDVTATDHEFAGVPATLDATTTGFVLVNEGQEIHELALARVNDGVTLTVDELVALPEGEALRLVTPVAAAFAEPGGTDTAFLELTPGRYVVVCFVPEGSIPPEQGTGPPHALLGMTAEFTVT